MRQVFGRQLTIYAPRNPTSTSLCVAEDIFNGKNTKAARRVCPQNLWKIASRKLDQLDSVNALDQLRIPPGNRLETLAGDRQGQHSIRDCSLFADKG